MPTSKINLVTIDKTILSIEEQENITYGDSFEMVLDYGRVLVYEVIDDPDLIDWIKNTYGDALLGIVEVEKTNRPADKFANTSGDNMEQSQIDKVFKTIIEAADNDKNIYLSDNALNMLLGVVLLALGQQTDADRRNDWIESLESIINDYR